MLFSWNALGIFLAALFTTTLCSKNIISFKLKYFLKFPAEKQFFFQLLFPWVLSNSFTESHACIFLWGEGFRASFSVSCVIACSWNSLWDFFMSFSGYTPVFDKSCANISSPAVIFKIEFTTISWDNVRTVLKPFLLMTFVFSFDHFPNGWDYWVEMAVSVITVIQFHLCIFYTPSDLLLIFHDVIIHQQKSILWMFRPTIWWFVPRRVLLWQANTQWNPLMVSALVWWQWPCFLK